MHSVASFTDSRDAAALRSLKDQWQNAPLSWDESNDPCGRAWEGITCNNSRVIALGLSTMGLKGKLGGDIGSLTELRSFDLSFNRGLTGPLSPSLGNLQKLNILILAGCGFSGVIPNELGNLSSLSFLALNSNNFTGEIPASLGRLSKLYWLDLADNKLIGSIPVSTVNSPGLDLLLHAKHFHFNKNRLTGTILPALFSSSMELIHILFDGNQLTGSIPSTIGLLQTLEVLRLDRNFLTGRVPSNLNNLTSIIELNLAHNSLSGPLPDLTGMNALTYVDLSNNSFDTSRPPDWFSTMQSLTILILEYGTLQGPLRQSLFGLSQLTQVKLRNNAINGTLNMGNNTGQQLRLVDLEDNLISSVTLGSGYKNTLILIGNPVCASPLAYTEYCQVHLKNVKPYSTSLPNCGTKHCDSDQKLSPQSCQCSYPYEGTVYFRAPFFRDLSNINLFHSLEMSLWIKLGLSPGSVSLRDPFFNADDYLQVDLQLFPSRFKFFTRLEVQKIGFELSNQTYKPPSVFGPYYFIALPYVFPATEEKNSISLSIIVGIAAGCGVLVLVIIGVGAYALKQKQRAERAIESSKPFASWGSSGNESSEAPQLKGARWFSYDELKKCSNNFSRSNQIGFGGYGKVYKGVLSNGQAVAIKRAQKGSVQKAQEFKTEVEMLSRVHHKNLVGLLGFCFEQGEQMLVYEFMPHGTLRDSLSGKSGFRLDWGRRMRIALDAAGGLAYLHDHANPPVIHRDVKSSNILMDANFTAKVADFGLSKLVQEDSNDHVSTQVKGTLGYMDPEYYTTQKLTEKSDVYSFGVVMLELLTAKQPIQKGKYIVREVRAVMDKNDAEGYYGLKDMIDPILVRSEAILSGFRCFLELALECTQEWASDRPSMSEAVKVMESILDREGLSFGPASASSSATDFGVTRSSLPNPNKEATDLDAFDYSGSHTLSARVEAK